MFEIELALGDWLWWDHMSGDMTLESIRYTNLDIVGVHSGHVMAIGSLGHDAARLSTMVAECCED
jgi:hypothetical protein